MATVNVQCNGFMTISWMLRGPAIMLSEVNFTITIDSMGSVERVMDINADSCSKDTMTCGQYLTRFTYSGLVGLTNNTLYNVSISTSINDTMYSVNTPVVTITMNTTHPGQ